MLQFREVFHEEFKIFATMLYEVNQGQNCWLGNFIVHVKYRKQGVGSYLIDTMRNIAKTEYEARELKLVCHHTNTRALLFYHKTGFKPCDMKVQEDYKGERICGIIMSIDL